MGRVIVTGPPGCGKSTLAIEAVRLLRERGDVVSGFTTREVRRGGRRTGFIVTGVGGRERTLAVAAGRGPRVGRYRVDVDAFEEVAVLELQNGLELGATLVVDEIGPMELLSRRFRELLPDVLAAERLLATVHARPHPLTDELKRRSDVELIRLTPENRGGLAALVAEKVAGR